MSSTTSAALSPGDPRWNEFIERLAGPDDCDFKTDKWTCFGDDRFTRKILEQMGLNAVSVDRSLAYFRKRGGYCDCEVIFNVHDAAS